MITWHVNGKAVTFNVIGRFEFATTVRYYWGERYYYICQILYTICMQTTNIAAMIISAQVRHAACLELLKLFNSITHAVCNDDIHVGG